MQPKITPEYLASQGLSPTFPERFWNKVQKTDGCWIWTAATDHNGYGAIMSRGKRPGNCMIGAHQGSWLLNRGPIPDGKCVLHACDQPLCVRPDHLWIGTQLDNVRDMIAKGRMAFGEKRAFAKLKWTQVRQIRLKYARGGITYRELANEFGVHCGTVGQIIRRNKWIRDPLVLSPR